MRLSQNQFLGILCLLFGGLLILVWAPLDSGNWYVVQVRGKYSIGDSMAPAFAGAIFLVSGLMMLFGPQNDDEPAPDRSDVTFIFGILATIVVGLVIMRFGGPAAAAVLGLEYRPLRDSVPWKFLGFGLGGFYMVATLVAFVEGRLTWRAMATGIGAVLLIIVLYDLPFEDLLLPPNGDV